MSAQDEAERQLEQVRLAVTGRLDRVAGLERAVGEAQGSVEDAAGEMVRRLEDSSEPLVAALRERAESLGAEVELVTSGVAARAGAEAAPAKDASPDEEPVAAQDASPDDEPAAAEDPVPEEPVAAQDDGAGADSGSARAGVERARLLALNMALGGTPRDEAERELREELGVEEPGEILDEAYGKAG